jgi:2-isopropylmalate synthase
MRRKVTFFDTTLRDGEQAPMNAMSTAAKVDLFRKLSAAKLDVIEAGFPAASDIDREAVAEILRMETAAKVCLFARAARSDLDCCLDLIGNRRDIQVQVLVTGSENHLRYKRQFSVDEALAETRDAVRFAADHGVEVSLAVEDASRGSADLLERVIRTGVDNGATTVVVTDTVGCATPDQFGPMVAAARRWAGEDVTLSVHCHDDLGLAVANTLAGLAAGADECQGTLCGIGERAGNAALEELLAIVINHGERLSLASTVDPIALGSACTALSAAIDFPIARNKAVVGRWVYATAAGLHQNGILKHPSTYESLDPAHFGREREFLITRHSGQAAVRSMLRDQPDAVRGVDADHVLAEMARLGRSFSSAEGEVFRDFVAGLQVRA